jgi:cytochrome c
MPSSPDAHTGALVGHAGRGARLLAAALLFSGVAAGASADGDPRRGEKIYERCAACHSIDRDRTGPRHEGLLGRRVGSVPGFAYSPAMTKAGKAGMVWDETTLDRFLENPTKAIPGTRMGYAGVKNAQERADLIAFLKEASAAR